MHSPVELLPRDVALQLLGRHRLCGTSVRHLKVPLCSLRGKTLADLRVEKQYFIILSDDTVLLLKDQSSGGIAFLLWVIYKS